MWSRTVIYSGVEAGSAERNGAPSEQMEGQRSN
jgi:hypothetical protein